MAKQDLLKLNQDLQDAIAIARLKKMTEVSLKPFFGGVSQIVGAQGTQGIQGIQGEKGLKGDKGDKGLKGDKGDKGDKGEAGIDGKNGLSTNGKDGKNGKDGENGKDGVNGLDGTLIEPSEIRNKLETLKDEDRLDASAIKNLPLPTISGRGGGGIAEIIAGTNITVQRNGPRVTVNSTASATGSGDVVGPAGAVADHVATFNGATGKIIKDSGLTLSGTNTGDQVADGVTITGAGTAIDPFVGVSGSSISRSISTVAVGTNMNNVPLTDYVYFVTGTTSLSLPTAIGNTNLYTITNIGVGIVTIAPIVGGQTLSGEVTQLINTQYDSVSFLSDGANWFII
jgi:hypothetical protein